MRYQNLVDYFDRGMMSFDEFEVAKRKFAVYQRTVDEVRLVKS